MNQSNNGKDPTQHDSTTLSSLSPFLCALHASIQTSLPCAEFRDHLSELYQLMQSKTPLPTEYRPYLDHLVTCSACAEEYAALAEAMAEFDAGSLPALDHAPQFDLSFIDSCTGSFTGDMRDVTGAQGATDLKDVTTAAATTQSPPHRLASPVAGLHRLIDDVWVIVQAAGARFGALPSSLAPVTVAAGRLRVNAETGPAEVLVLPTPDAGFSVHLTVGLVVNGKAAISVKVVAPDTTQPVADIRVTLRNSAHQLLAGAVTGHDGTTLFEQLPLGRYFVQVRHTDQTWEIPLMLVEGKPNI